MDKLERWCELSAMLKSIKKEEGELRREICAELFEGKIGEFTVKTEYLGTNVQAKSVLNRKIDEPALGAIWHELTDKEKAAIKLKPTLTLPGYRAIDEDSLLHQAIIVTAGMPTLKVDE